MLTIVANSLIEKLKEIQSEEDLSDYRFAEKLGVSHQLWQMTRTGKREIGLVILKAVLKVYPELYRDVLFFLGGDGVNLSMFNAIATTPSEMPYQNALNQNLGVFFRKMGKTICQFLRGLKEGT